ncbi:hypothetical protein [Xanthomonas bundabergensis]
MTAPVPARAALHVRGASAGAPAAARRAGAHHRRITDLAAAVIPR